MSSGSRRSEYFPIVGRLLSRIAFFSFQLFLFLVLVCSVWVTSALLYSILYNWTIPLAELRVPVFLDYRPNQLDAFAIANSSLVSRQWTPSRQLQELYHGFRADNLLNAKELYDVDLLLSIPESNVNSACGVVTIVAEICSSFKKLESRDFVKLAESTRSVSRFSS